MKKLLLALLLLFVPSSAWAQCSGAFPNNTVCGNITGQTNTPRSTPMSSIVTSSIALKTPVDVATTANITLSGEQTIDGVLTSNSRVLVKNQSTPSQNGIYVSSSGAWSRASDFNATGQVSQGTQVRVSLGNENAGAVYSIVTANPITVGSSSIFFSSFITVPDYIYQARKNGVVCDGSTDDGANINTAISTVHSSGGGVVVLPAGTCMTSVSIVQRNNVALVGQGVASTIVKLLDSSNTNLLTCYDDVNGVACSAATGTQGATRFVVSSLTLDGNRAANSTGDCVNLYGYRYTMADVTIQNCAENGLHTSWTTGGTFPMEATFSNITIDTVGNNGWWMNGPHDSKASSITIVDAGQSANATYDGLFVDANGGLQVNGVHTWHRSTVVNRTRYGANVTAASIFSQYEFEASYTANLMANASGSIFDDSGSIYNPWNGINIIINQPTTLKATVQGACCSRPDSVGVVIGDGSGGSNPSFSLIDIKSITNNLGSVDFTNSAGRNSVSVLGFATSGPGYIGFPATSDDVELHSYGSTTLDTLYFKDGPFAATSFRIYPSGSFASNVTYAFDAVRATVTWPFTPFVTKNIALGDSTHVWTTLHAQSATLYGSVSGTWQSVPPNIAGTSVVKWPAGSTDFTTTFGVVQQASTGAPFTVGPVGASSIAAQAANTVLGNATSGSAAPTALPVGSCDTATKALQWTTNTGFGCSSSINAATLGGATFSAPGAIGGGTPSSGAFTTLSASGTSSAGATSGFLLGSNVALIQTGNFTIIKNSNGATNISVGNSTVAANYYDQDTQHFRTAAASEYFTLSSTGAVATGYVKGTRFLSTIAAPTASTCGTSPIVDAGSSNSGGSFTTGTGSPTACTITLAAAYPTNAYCVITPANTAAGASGVLPYISAQNASGFTVTLAVGTSTAKFNYNCSGN